MPVMLLGLKRDERTETKNEDGEFECVMPEEGLAAAQEMRCDRYAECSAITGELMWEVLEDITRTAAKTTTEKGGLSEGPGCHLM
jgi:Ras homolog gene family, member A